MDFTHLKSLFSTNVPQWVSGTVFSGIELGDGYRYIYDSVSNGYGGYRSVNLYLLNDNDPAFARCIVNEQGYIITDRSQKTSVEGLYAAGDMCVKPLRQVVTAVADGAAAVHAAEEYLAAGA